MQDCHGHQAFGVSVMGRCRFLEAATFQVSTVESWLWYGMLKSIHSASA
jgi:hypothetical protein